MERKGKRGKVHGWESERAGMGAGEKVFLCTRGRKEGSDAMQQSMQDSPVTPQRPHCVKGPRARGVTDGNAPGTDRSQMTSDRRGNGDIGLEGTRRIRRPASRDGLTALIAS